MIANVDELIKKCKECENIIIYGAGLAGMSVVQYLLSNEIDIFCIAVTETKNNPSEILGVPVCAIGELFEYRKNSAVIIATLEDRHPLIKESLVMHGFENIYLISNVCYAELRKSSWDYTPDILLAVRGLYRQNEEIMNTFQEQITQSEKRLNWRLEQINEISSANYKSFYKYENFCKGKDVVIVATGPTLNFYEPIEGAVHIGVNKAYKFKKVNLDYLFACDNQLGEKTLEEIKEVKCQKFIGEFLMECDHRDFQIPCKYITEDDTNRYYFDAPPSDDIYRDIRFHPLMNFGSITFPAIHFALFTNAKRIYLVGCDCSDLGYYDGSSNWYPSRMRDLQNWKMGYEKLKEFAALYYPDTEIISINPVGLKGYYKDVYTDSYLKEHPEIKE
jgi:hypothetical protein